MIRKELIDLSVDAEDELELFDFVGLTTYKKGFSKLGYISSLERRELSYPTGLQFPKITIALPHVDSKYIEEPFIFVVRNKKMIDVKQMGDKKKLKTQYFLFLGIKNGTNQPKLLSNLMALFQDEVFVEKFLKVNTNQKMYTLLIESKI
jgi:PTS system galactitol-specific IIA component